MIKIGAFFLSTVMAQHFFIDHHKFVEELITDMAEELTISVRKVKRHLFGLQTPSYHLMLWEKIDTLLPGHAFEYVGKDPHTKRYELRDTDPLMEALFNEAEVAQDFDDGTESLEFHYFCPTCHSCECECSL